MMDQIQKLLAWAIALPLVPKLLLSSIIAGIALLVVVGAVLMLVVIWTSSDGHKDRPISAGDTAMVTRPLKTARPKPTTPAAPVQVGSVTGGSVIVTQNQMGGQAAHQIVNVGRQPRQVSEGSTKALLERLKGTEGQEFEVEVVEGDSEARSLAFQLHEILAQAGWRSSGFATSLFPFQPRHLMIQSGSEGRGAQILREWATAAGLRPEWKALPGVMKVHVIVGANL